MELLVATALGGAVAALFTGRAADDADDAPAHLGALRIPVRDEGRSAEETVAKLEAMIRALDGDRRAR
ncbi:MAG: hypothetical protein ACFCUS_13975 [Rubrimonas sp.]